MADREDDLRIGVKSSAILFGDADIVMVGIIQAMVITALLLIGQSLNRGPWFYTGLLVAVALVIYQLYLIRKREPKRCIQAFLNNNYLGLMVFVGIVLDYALYGQAPT